MTDQERYRGCLLGLACGDALGTTVEFMPRGSFAPLTTLVGGGPFGLPVGAWTDDCSMALCLGHSLIHRGGFDAVDQMNRYCNWARYGYMSSTGECFDIGITVSRALERYRQTGDPFAGSSDPMTAGNGSLMRLAPVAMFYQRQPGQLLHFATESARTTHAAEEALDCTRWFALQLAAALGGAAKRDVCFPDGWRPAAPAVKAIAQGAWLEKAESEIRGSGYAVESLEAALWCFWSTDSYEAAVLAAANLGEDADTTAAIAGQLAGAFYGIDAIPSAWLQCLVMREDIQALADRLLLARVA